MLIKLNDAPGNVQIEVRCGSDVGIITISTFDVDAAMLTEGFMGRMRSGDVDAELSAQIAKIVRANSSPPEIVDGLAGSVLLAAYLKASAAVARLGKDSQP